MLTQLKLLSSKGLTGAIIQYTDGGLMITTNIFIDIINEFHSNHNLKEVNSLITDSVIEHILDAFIVEDWMIIGVLFNSLLKG